jgi:SAM-dependent methyltransferase
MRRHPALPPECHGTPKPEQSAVPGRYADATICAREVMRAVSWRSGAISPTGERLLEITDLLWQADRDGGRLQVRKADVLAHLVDRGQRRAARIVSRMPSPEGVLDPDYVDALGIRVHCELLRLGEELQFGRRVAAQLVPMVATLRAAGSGVMRVVDIGCGLGYVLRSLAIGSNLGPDVELVGIDMNPAIVARARDLAAQEGTACQFICGDAFRPQAGVRDAGSTIFISSGLMHHIPPHALPDFFAVQAEIGIAAFAHWDIAPCAWSTLGAWVFHQARMREPVSRHDGVMSARRAYPESVLAAAADAGAPAYHARVLEGPRWHPRGLDVLRPIVGLRQ